MLVLEAIPNSGIPTGYRCRCNICARVTRLTTLIKTPDRQIKPEVLEPLLQTLLGGKLLPEPQGDWNLNLHTFAQDMVRKWRKQLKELGCEHHYFVVRK